MSTEGQAIMDLDDCATSETKEGKKVIPPEGNNKDKYNDIDDDEVMNDMMDVHFPVMDGDNDDDSHDDEVQVKPLVSLHNGSNDKGGEIISNGVCAWDDGAVLRCFSMAVRSHDIDIADGGILEEFEAKTFTETASQVSNTALVAGGEAGSTGIGKKDVASVKKDDETEKVKNWMPREVPLPLWSIDPLYAP
uniref:Uncharacterized protein n=1 Tax=Helicotheca tamesis TaxID=374047 RepID=A0A7S2MZG5_9STRA